jgi:hypothetical protein
MRLSIICASLLVAGVTWAGTRRLHAVLIACRARWWRALVAVVGLGLGWTPASHGNVAGYVLMAAGITASTSLATEAWQRIGEVWAWRLRHQPRPTSGPGRPQESAGTALTDLDQAAVHRAMLASYLKHLVRADDASDLETQQLLAAEIEAAARRLREALDVVIVERHGLADR